MKKYFIMAAIAAVTLASCSTADDEVATNPSKTTDPVAVTLSNTLSKATTRAATDLQGTQIVSGVQVGVCVFPTGTIALGPASDYVGYWNSSFTSNGAGALSIATPIYYPVNGDQVDIYAYAPVNTEYQVEKINALSFSVKPDQSADANYLASDLICADKITTASTTTTQNLAFTHSLAKITVSLQPDATPTITEAQLKTAKIELLNTYLGSTFDLTTKTVAVTNGEGVATGTVIAKTAEQNTISSSSAIIIPQTLAINTQFIKITIGTTEYVYSIPSTPETGMTFAGGNDYKYTITVSATGIKVSSSITNWGTTTDQTGTATQQ
jgi:hypothetical protein